MSGWRQHAVPLLILSALLGGCQAPPGGRITLDLPVLRTARVDATAPWLGWWKQRGADESTGRAQLASLPDADRDDLQDPRPAEPGVATAEPGRLPEPITPPIPIETADPTEFLPRPAGSDWTLRP